MVHGRLVPGGDCAVILSNLPSGVQSIDDVLQNHTLVYVIIGENTFIVKLTTK